MSKIFIITPLKDEEGNIYKLIQSIENQLVFIDHWIILENDCADKSIEILNKITSVKNVGKFEILNLSFESKEYSIGFKYSEIVQIGFDYINDNYHIDLSDYICLLDADSFPENDYLLKLINELDNDKKLGLVGGILKLVNGDLERRNNLRGSGRVWRFDCFKETGMYYGLSPDAITKRKAELCGWKTKIIKDAYFISRESNSRVSFSFRGKSAYYNGYTILFATIKSFYFFFNNPVKSIQYYYGYFSSLLIRIPKNPDKDIIDYNKNHLERVLRNKLSRKF